MKFDYVIAGQGIAGSVLALELHKRGRNVLIISREDLSSSSAVAAGIYNPFNFRRTIPTRFADVACPLAAQFYKEAEVVTGARFHEQKKIIRVFADEGERERWNGYMIKEGAQFIQPGDPDPELAEKIHAPFGGGIVTGGGVLNTGAFIYAVREFFRERNAYREQKFPEWPDVSVRDGIDLGDIVAKKLIFCEGHFAAENKYYPRLSIVPTKGETLHVSVPGLNLTDVINGGVYLSPLGNDLYACGATFNPGKNDEDITTNGREELVRKLQNLVRLPFRAESQFAGVRPAGRDRKPVIGISHRSPNVAIFNGFGSKGVLLAPYLAQLLVNHMESGAEIPAEISLRRFKE